MSDATDVSPDTLRRADLSPHASGAVAPYESKRAPSTFARAFRAWARNPRVLVGAGVLALILAVCAGTLPFTGDPGGALYYNDFNSVPRSAPPSLDDARLLFGSDDRGRSVLARTLYGGVVSLSVGVVAAAISVALGVTVGLVAGYRGGWVDAVLMRLVDVLYALPYLLLVIVFKLALQRPLEGVVANLLDAAPPFVQTRLDARTVSSLAVLFFAIGLVSWLTMARVIRGQVLSLRDQPFVEAARALGVPGRRIFLRHVLPNLVGPILVYATLTVPGAILQESFLSFLGIGVDPSTPTWGQLASDYRLKALSPIRPQWWTLLFPCALLAVTLLALNFLGDGLRDLFDPRRDTAKL